MEQLIRIGMDTSKSVFQLHGVDALRGRYLRKQLRREAMVAFFPEASADGDWHRGVRMAARGAARVLNGAGSRRGR